MGEQLILAVSCYPVLYDLTLDDYRNTILKLDAWKKVAEELGLPVDEVKRKWKHLRDAYRRELNKAKDRNRSGAGADRVRPWKYASIMSFLAPFVEARETTGNMYLIESGNESGDAEGDEGQVSQQVSQIAPLISQATLPLANQGVGQVSQAALPLANQGVGQVSQAALPLANQGVGQVSQAALPLANQGVGQVSQVAPSPVRAAARGKARRLNMAQRVSQPALLLPTSPGPLQQQEGQASELVGNTETGHMPGPGPRPVSNLLPTHQMCNKRSRVGSLSTFERHLVNAIERSPSPQPTSDPDDLFLQSLLPQLKLLSIRKKEEVKFHIHRLIFEARQAEAMNEGV